jgi:hypothetical protein
MQLARRISLLLAFSLLTSATTAYAECAWVMWELGPVVPQKWEPVTSFRSEQNCVQVRQIMARERYVEPYADSPKTYETLRCLPDSIDPRGPKGK